MLCQLHSATLVGVDAIPVEVQVDVSGGLPGFHVVGLAAGAVREGGVRIRAALQNCGFELGAAKITVNLAPADLRKDGSAFDLPIALALLTARGLLEPVRRDLLVAGELSLDGRVLPVPGALPMAETARRRKLSGIVLPRANAREASMVERLPVFAVETLGEAVALLRGERESTTIPAAREAPVSDSGVDFADVAGQEDARYAAEVAAAGGHNLMLIGPPGSGKTMIALRLGGILPPLTRTEAIETTKIHSVAGLLRGRPLVTERPFRAPHHTCSSVGLVGGGSRPRPGEVSLAHNGVLFLDELPEFQRGSLEALRQPLEEARVTIVRAQQALTFPARFMLVAAMNPCPCGYRHSTVRTCTCGEREAARYRARISGPLLDRFDIFVHVAPVPTRTLLDPATAERSTSIAERVGRARLRQQRRFARSRIHCNAQMSTRQLRTFVSLSPAIRQLMERCAAHHQLSARALHRACRVARTLADLADRDDMLEQDVSMALAMQQARWLD